MMASHSGLLPNRSCVASPHARYVGNSAARLAHRRARCARQQCNPHSLRLRAAAEQDVRQSASSGPEDLTPSDAEVVPIQTQLLLPAADSRFQGKKAFVAGASGRTGREIVQRLVGEQVPVRAFVRNAVKAVQVLPGLDKEVELIEGDVYQYQTIPEAMQGCDVVLCATGASTLGNPLDPFFVDYEGTLNLIAVAKCLGVKKFVLVSSIGVDELLSPFNLFGGLAFWKKQAEEALQRSGMDYTIVRPGGLRSQLPSGQKAGGVVMAGPSQYGLLPGKRFPTGSILRSQVAECCVEALVEPAASFKVVEIVTDPATPNRPYSELFAGVGP